jgi:hypothetical protein
MRKRLTHNAYRRYGGVCLLVMWIALGLLSGCQTPGTTPAPDLQPIVAQWPSADRLFRSEPRWLGADGAHSIDLQDGRVLWLFGDTFIDIKGSSQRRDAALIRNSVALQQGYDPLTAPIEFIWGGRPGFPQAFFKSKEPTWLWPGHGVRLDDDLLIFMLQIKPADNALGFALAGTRIARLAGVDGTPQQWRVTWLNVPTRWFSRPWATAHVLTWEGFVYAFMTDDSESHAVSLARWPEEVALHGDLARPQWWAGQERGWALAKDLRQPPAALFAQGQTEFTVHYEPRYRRFIQIQALGFGGAQIGYRSAAALTGPWSAPTAIYRPPEHGIGQILIYGAQAHPALQASDLVLTYSTNHLDSQVLLTRTDLYYPRFLQCRFFPGR